MASAISSPTEEPGSAEAVPAVQPGDWFQFRGAHRTGRVEKLPASLPASLATVWKMPLSIVAHAGVAVAAGRVFVADRTAGDRSDTFACFDSRTGERLWELTYPAPGRLDYGNAPRATPLIADGLVYFLGGFGHLHCCDITNGDVIWSKQIRDEFQSSSRLVWGVASSPLIVDGLLIINPGGPQASVVALDPEDGTVRWKTPGAPAAFASFMVAQPSGHRQLVGYDKQSLGGWEIATGRRLWSVFPTSKTADFNVPTPIPLGEQLLVTTENNGMRLYQFDSSGVPGAKPRVLRREIAPDTHTPVVVGNRVFGVWNGLLVCSDLQKDLVPVWTAEHESYNDYCSIIADDARLLITTSQGELVLVDATADEYREIARRAPFPGESGLYSHPAVVGTQLFMRVTDTIACLELVPPEPTTSATK